MKDLVIMPQEYGGITVSKEEFGTIQRWMNQLGLALNCNIQLAGFYIDERQKEIKESNI